MEKNLPISKTQKNENHIINKKKCSHQITDIQRQIKKS